MTAPETPVAANPDGGNKDALGSALSWFESSLRTTTDTLLRGLAGTVALLVDSAFDRGFAEGVRHSTKKPTTCRCATVTTGRAADPYEGPLKDASERLGGRER